MIYENDQLQYSDVYSKEYICQYNELNEKLKEFSHIMECSNLTFKKDLFYSIKGFRKDGGIRIEFFAPATQYKPVETGNLNYHSYYFIDSMLSVIVMSDFERNMELAYAALIYYAEEHNMDITSAIYNEIRRENGMVYIIVKVAVQKSGVELDSFLQ